MGALTRGGLIEFTLLMVLHAVTKCERIIEYSE